MSAKQTPDYDLTDRGIYKAWTSHTIRYNDQDTLGHVNNAVYSTFFEAGRTAILQPLFKEHQDRNLDIVLARIIVDYRRELSYPGAVDIGTSIKRIGNTSVVFLNGIFDADSAECSATGEAYLVFFDLVARKSTPPPPKIRELLEKLLIT
ncbi:MAG: acyl-CoA thioesterase [Hyphomicrobiaceae bacterium]